MSKTTDRLTGFLLSNLIMAAKDIGMEPDKVLELLEALKKRMEKDA